MADYGDKDAIIPDTHPDTKFTECKHPVNKLKYAILAFSFIFWIVGGLFSAIGAYINTQIFDYEDLSKLAFVPGSIILFAGAIIFVMSTFGVLGAYRENIRFLNAYKIFLIFILFLEVFLGFLGFAFWPEVKKMVDIKLSEGIRFYTRDSHLAAMMNLVQRELECCGSLTIDDWDSNEYFSCRNIESYKSCGVPWSCCHHRFYRNRQCGYGIRGYNHEHRDLKQTIYMEGCLDKTFEFFKANMRLVGGLAVASSIPIIFGIFMIRKLLKQIGKHIDVHKEGLMPLT